MSESATKAYDPSLPVEDRINHLIEQMTLPEKIGQMTQIEKNSITPEQVREYAIGSVLSGGGGNPPDNNPQEWAAMVRAFQDAALKTRLSIPLVYGVDAVHGHNNMYGATIFPHNIGLGAANDAELVEKVARITAREMLAVNVHWDFAPAVSVPQDIRWGRTFEGFSENTELVSKLGAAFVRGMQDAPDGERHALTSIKHFVADGGTRWGSTGTYPWIKFVWQGEGDRWQIDQGVSDIDEEELRRVHLPPYIEAIKAGALNIMVSYTTWDGVKMHGHHYLLTDVLKNELNFNGFLVSDWMAISQLDEDFYQCVVKSINAGLDMIMVPYDARTFITTLERAVNNGDVSVERVDDAVRRILRAKIWLGLFEQPYGEESLLPEVGSDAHRAVAREAVRKSLVLLKNDNDALPLAKDSEQILVAGAGADNIGIQCGGWSIEWMGAVGNTTPGTTILQGLQEVAGENVEITYAKDGKFEDGVQAKTAVVVVGELPYAEGEGDRGDLSLSADDRALIARVRQRCERLVLVIVSGRPLILGDAIDKCDAIVAAWLPGTEGSGVADVLFGDYPFTGKLSYTWPRSMDQVPLKALRASGEEPQWAFGYGLS